MTRPGAAILAAAVLPFVPPAAGAAPPARLPTVRLREAEPIKFPAPTDCNSPAHWNEKEGRFYIFHSLSPDPALDPNAPILPARNFGKDVFDAARTGKPALVTLKDMPRERDGRRWIEATHLEKDGTLYGWYHNEPPIDCPNKRLTAPRIGAMKSMDDGATWQDLGFILEAAPGTLRCDTANYYFAGGNGDFSVLPDAKREYLYIYFSTYWGGVSQQGVGVARVKYADRDAPAGKAWKWHEGQWKEPGIGGKVTPIFPARTDWHSKTPDVLWGPSIHWNTYLGLYVILLNRAEDPNWKEEGVYITYNADLRDPRGWSEPKKILDGGNWYPQVIGTDAAKRETDKLAGREARLFVGGHSRWEIVFRRN